MCFVCMCMYVCCVYVFVSVYIIFLEFLTVLIFNGHTYLVDCHSLHEYLPLVKMLTPLVKKISRRKEYSVLLRNEKTF